MNLYDALVEFAAVARCSADKLLEYANEDKVNAGRNIGGYSSLSVTRDEGKFLYAIVRHFKPNVAIEIGSHSGCSAMHIIAAMRRNRRGHLWCIDPGGIVSPGIPEKHNDWYSLIEIDARQFEWPDKVDFCFEDGDHTADLTSIVCAQAVLRGAECVIAHDAHNASVGTEVRKGMEQAVGYYRTVDIDGAGLGFAYHVKDGLYAPK